MTEPLGRKFSVLAKSYLGVLSMQLSHLGIERSFYPLLVIGERSAEGPLTQQQLADILNVDKVTAQRHVDYLVGARYIIKTRSVIDKRSFLLTLTEKAERELNEISSTIENLNNTLLESLGKEGSGQFLHMVDQLLAALTHQPSISMRIRYKRAKDE